MPTFSKTVLLDDGKSHVIERTTDEPGEITRMRYSGWEQKREKESPEKPTPTALPAGSGPKTDQSKP